MWTSFVYNVKLSVYWPYFPVDHHDLPAASLELQEEETREPGDEHSTSLCG